jgi:hypothetical protein
MRIDRPASGFQLTMDFALCLVLQHMPPDEVREQVVEFHRSNSFE